METPTNENTLEINIDKEMFAKFTNGEFKSYELPIHGDNEYYLLKSDRKENEIDYNDSLVDKEDERIGDPFFYNNGKFPYYPIPFQYIRFYDGISRKASNAMFKVLSFIVDVVKDDDGKVLLYEFDKKNNPYACENGSFSQWIITYHLGEMVEKNIKTPVEVKTKNSVDPDGTMHGLSVRQPWATLLCTIKDVENRSWSTNLRGKLLIHASRCESIDPWDLLTPEQTKIVKAAIKKGIIPGIENLPTGCYVGYATLTDCMEGDTSLWAEPDCIHWKFKDPHLFKYPIEGIKGKLGFLKYKGELPE